MLHTQSRANKAFHKTILLIKVPKEKKSENQQQSNEDNINQVREQIAIAETLFAAVGGLKPEKDSWRGCADATTTLRLKL